MRNHAIAMAAAVVLSGLCCAAAPSQNASDTMDAHLIAAREAAGFDFTGTLARLCVVPPPVTGPPRDAAPGPAPPRETWYAEPAKVFDNLYFVGSKIHNSWALTTSQGIILIDNSEEEIIGREVRNHHAHGCSSLAPPS